MTGGAGMENALPVVSPKSMAKTRSSDAENGRAGRIHTDDQ
jgi:hypothetical protein